MNFDVISGWFARWFSRFRRPGVSVTGTKSAHLSRSLWQQVGVLSCLVAVSAGTAKSAQPLYRPQTQIDPAALCELAAQSASRTYGVPRTVLTALMLTESGRKQDKRLRPWPWTVNMEGAGYWFETEADARTFVDRYFRSGARSFDVGCFQVNYKWHNKGFASIEEMFDPLANARYAAQFLRELFIELGSWDKAAGAYHSRTPDLAARYRARFLQHYARIASDGAGSDLSIPVLMAENPLSVSTGPANGMRGTISTNSYPLLQTGSGTRMGSLVPTGLFRARPILGTGPEG